MLLKDKKFLLTGSTGRLGTALSARLEELGAEVIPLITEGYPVLPNRVSWQAKNKPLKILNSYEYEELETPDYVINLHWRVQRALPFTEQLQYELSNNVTRLSHLWQWLKRKPVKKFINISSIKIFSDLNKGIITSETEPSPVTPYGIIKVTAEKFFDFHFKESKFPVVHLRLSSVSSYGENPSQLMSQLYKSTFFKNRITVNTGHISYLLYIDEAVDLIISGALNAVENKYNLVPEGVYNEEIAGRFEYLSGRKLNAGFQNCFPGENDPVIHSDIDKIKESWVRSYSLNDTIIKMIEENQINQLALQA